MAREWVREGTFENGFDVVESFVTLMRRVELLCTDGSFHYTTLRMPQFFRLPFPPGGESVRERGGFMREATEIGQSENE